MIAQVENNYIKCFDCFYVKDDLKKIGFKWNKKEKAWESVYSKDIEFFLKELGFKIVKKNNTQLDEELIKELKERNPKAFYHQIYASALAIKEKSFLIGDEPGVGKTFTALIWSEYLLAKNLVDIVFIFCPASIKRQWQQEVHKWLNETAFVINGDKRKRSKIFHQIRYSSNIKIVILNYELLLTNDTYAFLNLFENFALVLDEASRLKNHKSKTYKAMKRLADKTEYKLAMTGTPIENSLVEFWAIGYLLKGKNFISWKDFEENHIYYTEIKPKYANFYIKKITGYKNLKSFLYQIQSFYIRRKKSDIREMPQLTEYTRTVEQSKIQQKLEERIISFIQSVAKDMKNPDMAKLTELSLLRVVADDPRMLLNSDSVFAKKIIKGLENEIKKIKTVPKIQEIKEILQEHLDKKILILTQFKKMAYILQRELKDYKTITITGDDNNDKKAIKIGAFKNKDYQILIGTDALTYGMSIDEADVLINFDIPWSVGKIIQRRDRIYRISSNRAKWVYYLISEGTEQKVWEILQNKKDLFNQVAEGEIMGDLKNEILKNILDK